MQRLLISVIFLLWASVASAQVKIPSTGGSGGGGGTGGTVDQGTPAAAGSAWPIKVTFGGSTIDPRDVSDRVARALGKITFDGAQPVTQSGSWSFSLLNFPTTLVDPISVRCVTADGSAFESCAGSGSSGLTDTELRATPVDVAVTSSVLPTGASTAARQDTSNTSLANIDGKITVVNTGAVVVSSSALPSGASTGAKQDSGNTSLASIDTKTPSLGQALAAASVPIVLTAAQLTTLTPLSTVAVTGTFWQTTQPISAAALPLPSGAATSAAQTDRSQQTKISDGAGNARSANVTAANALVIDGSAVIQPVSGVSLASIDGKLPTTLGQKAMAASLGVTLASDQTALPVNQGLGNLTSAAWPFKLTDATDTANITGTSLDVNVTAGVGLVADASSFSAGLSNAQVFAGVFNDGLSALSSAQVGAPRITDRRALHVNFRNASGTEIGTASNPIQVSLANTAANATAVKVDGSAVTQPISGSLTNISGTISLPTGASTSSNQTTEITALQIIDDLPIAQGAAIAGKTGPLAQGYVKTGPPTYVDSTVNPLSLETNGDLRTYDGRAVDALGSVIDAITNPHPVVQDTTNLAPGEGWFVRLTSAADALEAGVKNTTPGGSDAGLIVRNIPSGTQAVSGTVTANQGTANTAANRWPVSVSDGTNSMPTMDAVGRAGFVKVTDGTNTGAVKAASTAAVATDPSQVVSLSPNNPLPTGSNVIGQLTANQSMNLAQIASVTTATGLGVADTGTQRVSLSSELTYSASTTAMTATTAGTGVFGNICGSASKTIRIQRIRVTGTVATGAKYGDVIIKKTSAATTSGTATTLTDIPYDSSSAAGTATAKYYTVLGTAGTPVGAIDSLIMFLPITGTPAATGTPIEFVWRDNDSEAPTLRGTAQCLELNFGTSPATAPTLTFSVKWTEK